MVIRSVWRKLHYLPVMTVSINTITIVATYYLSVKMGHVVAVLPFISDTGALPPESTIFSTGLAAGSLLALAVVYVRFLEVNKLCSLYGNAVPTGCLELNRCSSCVGCVIACCLCVVGCVQQMYAAYTHMAAACLCFALCGLYMALQARLSFKLRAFYGQMWICVVRAVMAAITTLCFYAAAVLATISHWHFQKHNPKLTLLREKMLWGPKNGYYQVHVVASACEWGCVIFTNLFLFTFTFEFQDLVIMDPEVRYEESKY